MVAPELKYYAESCGQFASFGWYSEREMAFTALITVLNFNGNVRTEGAHSKSELLIPMNSTSGSKHYFHVTVDNTYDTISWLSISNKDSIRFKNQFANSIQSDWYNNNAKSPVELSKISNHNVSNRAMINIENRIVNYLKSKITSGNSLNN